MNILEAIDKFGEPYNHALACPDCGQPSFQLGSVAIEQRTDTIWVGRDGLEEDPGPRIGFQMPNAGCEGSVVRINLVGQCGHDFSSCLES